MNLGWWLERSFWEWPDKAAVIDADGTETTYADLRALADRTAHVLARHGLRPGDVAVSALPDDHRHVALFFATIRAGAAFSGLNLRAKHERLLRDVAQCRARLAVVAAEQIELGVRLARESEVRTVFVVGREPGAAQDGLVDLDPLVAQAPPRFRIVDRAADDLVAVNFTSGTSGESKAVQFTHGTLGTSAAGAICLGGVSSRTRNLSLVGMHHSGGIHDCVRMAMAGGTIVWTDGWDVDRVVRIIETQQPNWMYWIIPTMARDLMRHPRWGALDLSGLRTYVAGEPVPPDVRDALLAKGAQVGNMYGLTEAMPVCVVGPSLYYGEETELPVGSSGRPVRGLCEVQLCDEITGAHLDGDAAEGEVCIRGDVVTPGYLHDPQRTAASFDADGYLHTRDRAYRDGDGWYYVRGRTDDIINPGGEKLSLLEVDDALRTHPDVVDVACVGVAHERFGEVPAAFVVMGPGIDEARARDMLDAHCLTTLDRWKRPRLYALVPNIARTAKQTKMHGPLKARLAGVVVREADGIATLGAAKARAGDVVTGPTIASRFAELVGIRYPIVQEGLGPYKTVALAAAVSNAGGLGTVSIPGISEEPRAGARILRGYLEAACELTDRPLAVNVPVGAASDGRVLPFSAAYVRAVVEAVRDPEIGRRIRVLTTSAGPPAVVRPMIAESGLVHLHKVGSSRQARRARAEGVDAVIASGYEAGGHTHARPVHTFVLGPAVARAVDCPVVLAGGICDGAGVAAAIALGADAVAMGTRFVASRDNTDWNPAYAQLILDAREGDDTTFPAVYGPSRVLPSRAIGELAALEATGTASIAEITAWKDDRLIRAQRDGDMLDGIMPAGQVSSSITELIDVANFVPGVVAEAIRVLDELSRRVARATGQSFAAGVGQVT